MQQGGPMGWLAWSVSLGLSLGIHACLAAGFVKLGTTPDLVRIPDPIIVLPLPDVPRGDVIITVNIDEELEPNPTPTLAPETPPRPAAQPDQPEPLASDPEPAVADIAALKTPEPVTPNPTPITPDNDPADPPAADPDPIEPRTLARNTGETLPDAPAMQPSAVAQMPGPAAAAADPDRILPETSDRYRLATDQPKRPSTPDQRGSAPPLLGPADTATRIALPTGEKAAVPVARETTGTPSSLGDDRIVVSMAIPQPGQRLDTDPVGAQALTATVAAIRETQAPQTDETGRAVLRANRHFAAGPTGGAVPARPHGDAQLLELAERVKAARLPDCIAALPYRSGTQLGLRIFAADDPDIELAQRKILNGSAAIAAQATLIHPLQCAALDYLAALPSYPLQSTGIALDRNVIASRETLAARLWGGSGDSLALLLVDDAGVVHGLIPYLSQGPAGLALEVELRRITPAPDTGILLIALQGARIRSSLDRLDGYGADTVFGWLADNLGQDISASITGFDLR